MIGTVISLNHADVVTLLNVTLYSDPDWWNVYVIRTGETGFIPRNFVAVEKSIESEEYVIIFLYVFISFMGFNFFVFV